MSCGWEGNRGSGVALAMRHRLVWFIQVWAQGLSKGNEHPPNLLVGYDTLCLYLYLRPWQNCWHTCTDVVMGEVSFG